MPSTARILGPMLGTRRSSVSELDRAVSEQANARPAVRRLMTHPGVGPITAMAFVLTMGPAQRFDRGKQVASYLGLIPSEHSSGGEQGWGASASRGIHSCVDCWWKRRRVRCGMSRSCVASINGWPSGSAARWRKWPSRGSWP